MRCKYNRTNCKFLGNIQVCGECLGGLIWTSGSPFKESTQNSYPIPKVVASREWKHVMKELPIVNMKVWGCWGPTENNIAEMKCIITYSKGVKKHKFYWRSIPSPWRIIYWQPYYVPTPPTFT